MKNFYKKVLALVLVTVFILLTLTACSKAHTHDYFVSEYGLSKHYLKCACGDQIEQNHIIENGKCSVCNFADILDENKVVKFGAYPQSEVQDENLINELIKTAGNPKNSLDGWSSYNYYDSDLISNNMYYKDIEFNGEKYRGVYIVKYRPFWTYCDGTEFTTYQKVNGYMEGGVYWFKYEDIEWEYINKDGYQILVAKLALDSQQFNLEVAKQVSVYYNQSTVRTWLNQEFFNTAFSEEDKAKIMTVEVDNSASTTGLENNKYVCENTFDKVYLLSFEQMLSYFADDIRREKFPTDYAKSQGILLSLANDNKICWWLRSPTGWHIDSAWQVTAEGHYDYYFHGASSTSCGIVPVIHLSK